MAKLPKGKMTKIEIAQAVKKLREVNSLESITVNDITEACGLNRLTFYYHFEDKYALLNWIYYNEIILEFRNSFSEKSWNANLMETLQRIEKDRVYYQNALAYDNHEFRRYMYEVMLDMYEDMISEWVDSDYIDREEIHFVASFFAHGTVGMIIDWVIGETKDTPEQMIARLQELSDDIEMMLISSSMQKSMEEDS